MIKSDKVCEYLEKGAASKDPLMIAPLPDLEALRKSGAASIDLRLGTWFLQLRNVRTPHLSARAVNDREQREAFISKMHYVPMGDKIILHPTSFVLGITMEWLRIPSGMAGYVTSKSSWGRRGLIIATATGVHPGFTGCLTLELHNVGEIPIFLHPGMPVVQFFLHEAQTDNEAVDASGFVVRRKPNLGSIKSDSIFERLSKPL